MVDDSRKDTWVSTFDYLLAKIVSKLINNHLRQKWKNLVSEAFVKSTCLDSKFIIKIIGYLLLQHSAANLVKAVEVEIAKNLLVLLA
jgi:hypothetical protein